MSLFLSWRSQVWYELVTVCHSLSAGAPLHAGRVKCKLVKCHLTCLNNSVLWGGYVLNLEFLIS